MAAIAKILQISPVNEKAAVVAASFLLFPKSLSFNGKRFQTTHTVHNPAAKIRNLRLRDPWISDGFTPTALRPVLPEAIQPVEMRYPKEGGPPWPYKEKSYFWYHKAMDFTCKRFDENTKLICVEGNIGSGKGKFARELAKILDFHFIEAPPMDRLLIDEYGIDKRNYYHLLPSKFQIFDESMYYTAPTHQNVINFQFLKYALKFEAYCNALAHILNTGQGVVMERSPHTDICFVETMYNRGYLSDAFVEYYAQLRYLAQAELHFHPHLYIYLDCPVSQCLENVKKRGRPWENNGKVIDLNYLSDLEKHTKNFLKTAEKDAEVLVFDWKVPGDMTRVAEDIYKVDFTYDFNVSDRFTSWNDLIYAVQWNDMREKYTQKHDALAPFNNEEYFHVFQVKELVCVPEELQQLRYVLENVVGKYQIGFNLDKGDKLWDILFPKSPNNYITTNAKWVEYLVREAIWSGQHQGYIYTAPPKMPNLTEEDFAPQPFDLASLEHSHHH